MAAQDEITALDARATRIAEYQPAVVPGLAQIPAYTRELLSVPGGPLLLGATPAQIEEKIAAQLRRQQQVLYAPSKRVQLIVGEAALRNTLHERATLLGQLDRLVALTGLENVQLGVLPFDAREPLVPVAGFALNDSDVVWVETATGEQRLDDPTEVDFYVQAFELALSSSVTGEDAVRLIRWAM